MTPSQTSGRRRMGSGFKHGVYVYQCTSNMFVYKRIYKYIYICIYEYVQNHNQENSCDVGILRNSYIISSISSDICGTSFNEHLTDLRGSGNKPI